MSGTLCDVALFESLVFVSIKRKGFARVRGSLSTLKLNFLNAPLKLHFLNAPLKLNFLNAPLKLIFLNAPLH